MATSSQPVVVAEELTPVNRIRVETTLSRYPIHRLSKSGGTAIDLYPDIQWKVSYNNDYGQPGPLAYKIDTLIVNRRLDEAPRPLPELIRLGSLREICRELGQSDHDTDIVKRALHQNASAYITAKVRQSKKGRDKWVELGYTRYSVVFTGEALPDGQTADAVYIVLNPQHRKFLNEVEVRPLDYDYLFRLGPASQRLYELLSFPIYGALSNDRPRARLRYSEFCMFAPVTRYYDYDPVKKQMSKIHKPHRESGYIVKTEFQETVDSKGSRDWEMFYTPGPKAIAEYRAFTNRSLSAAVLASLSAPKAPVRQPVMDPVQVALDLQDSDNAALLHEMTRRGITEKKACDLLAGAHPGQPIVDQLEYVDTLIRHAPPGKFHNPSGFYIKFIADNAPVPDSFWSSRKQRLHEVAQEARNAERANAARLEMEYDEYQRQVIERYIAEMPSEDYRTMIAESKRGLKRTYGGMTEPQVEEIASKAVRNELRKSGAIPLLSFGEFSAQVRRNLSE
jgi:hypothetical protein